jgi:hypothetical protein
MWAMADPTALPFSQPGRPPTTTGVAEACAEVMRRAREVKIDEGSIARLCDALGPGPLPIPAFDRDLHFFEGTWRSANYVLVLDALNFSFWPDPGAARWKVAWQGREWGGYWALTAALRRAVEERVPILEAGWLAEISIGQVERLLRGSEGVIPLLDARQAHLQEVGRVLLSRYDGRFVNMVEESRFDAVALTLRLAEELYSFADVARYDDLRVPLYKRAQIAPVDLFGTFEGKGPGRLQRLDELTAFADYKVPQVLRRLGVLHYGAELAATVDSETRIRPGDPLEVEIRAATVDAVERVRRALAVRGTVARAFEIDWLLWGLSQKAHPDDRPYHKTRTVYY